MKTFGNAIEFLFDNTGLIWDKTVEHIWLSVASLGVAMAIAIPLGVWLGHRHRGSFIAIGERFNDEMGFVPRRGVDKLILSYVFEGVFQGHLAKWREVEGVVGAKTPRNAKCSRSRRWSHPFDGSVTRIRG